MQTNVAKVIAAGLCTVCGTCVGLCPRGAPQRRFDLDQGATIVVDDDRCTECGVCSRACPGQTVELAALADEFLGPLAWRSSRPFTRPALRHGDMGEIAASPRELAEWFGTDEGDFVGLHRRCFCGWASDEKLRHEASSGGVVTGLLLGALAQGEIDGAVVTRMHPERPLEAESYIARTPDEVRSAIGSKYTIASPDLLLGDLLRRRGRYAFVGLPCHVAGLRKAQLALPVLRQRVSVVVGLFCGTTNTPRAAVVGIRRAGLRVEDVRMIAYRGPGWPGGFRVTTKTGGVHEVPYPDYYDPWFAAHIRSRCLVCPDGLNELADVAVGDAWVERYLPPRSSGASFVIVRHPSAASLLRRLQPDWLHLEEASVAELVEAQRETHAVKREGVRGNRWLDAALGRTLPEYPGHESESSGDERRAAIKAATVHGAYRALGRLRYRAPRALGAGRDSTARPPGAAAGLEEA